MFEKKISHDFRWEERTKKIKNLYKKIWKINFINWISGIRWKKERNDIKIMCFSLNPNKLSIISTFVCSILKHINEEHHTKNANDIHYNMIQNSISELMHVDLR